MVGQVCVAFAVAVAAAVAAVCCAYIGAASTLCGIGATHKPRGISNAKGR
jgi:hypothetical protein